MVADTACATLDSIDSWKEKIREGASDGPGEGASCFCKIHHIFHIVMWTIDFSIFVKYG